jgi:hypothetical protein
VLEQEQVLEQVQVQVLEQVQVQMLLEQVLEQKR